MNDEQFRIACEKELKYIAKQERKLQKQAMASGKSWKNAIEGFIPEKVYINLRGCFCYCLQHHFREGRRCD